MSAPPSGRRRRIRFWFVFYTAVLLAIVGVSIASRQWSVALTALATAILFGLFTRRLWRRH